MSKPFYISPSAVDVNILCFIEVWHLGKLLWGLELDSSDVVWQDKDLKCLFLACHFQGMILAPTDMMLIFAAYLYTHVYT